MQISILQRTLSSLLTLAIPFSFAFAADGDLDTTFDTDGKVTTNNFSSDIAQSVEIQTDGKIITAGKTSSNSNDFMVVRYNTDGSLDNTFDSDGIATTDIGTSSSDILRDMVIQTDGKIVAAGFSNASGNNDFTVVRYNTDGSLDNTFDTDGIVTTDIGTSTTDIAAGIAVQTDGKIVVGGSSANDEFILVRYNTDGSLDNTFDTDGIATASFTATSTENVSEILIQDDGKIIVIGLTLDGGGDIDFGIMRFNTDGSLDNTFSTDGKIIVDFSGNNDFAEDIAIQDDGDIVVVGFADNGTNDDFALLRLTSSGNLDTDFDTDGKLTTQPSAFEDQANSVRIQNDGKIVVGGSTQEIGDDFCVVRYNSDGSLDGTFGTAGVVITHFLSGDEIQAIVLQNDGKIVAAGHDGTTDFALARYENTDIPLAVELSDFSAKAGDSEVTLNWKTESEIENLGFEIYRSEKGKNFTKVASYETTNSLKGAGNSAKENFYSFIDQNLRNGKTYTYKIADVDFGGFRTFHSELSVVPSLEISQQEAEIKSFELAQNYPNPFNPTTTISYELKIANHEFGKLVIFNALGKKVKEFVLKNSKGSVVWNGTDNFGKSVSNGTYFYQIKNSIGESLTRKMQLIK